MDIQLSTWADFKATCIVKKNLNCQFGENDTRYELVGPDANGLSWVYELPKGTPDATDFETNYKAAFNWAVGGKTYAFASPDFQFQGDCAAAVIPAGGTGVIDYKMPKTLYIDGAMVLTQNAAFGDFVTAIVVDRDNVLGYGAGLVLAQYVVKWWVDPGGSMQVRTPYAGKVPAGIVMRLAYNSVGAQDVKVFFNLSLHLGL